MATRAYVLEKTVHADPIVQVIVAMAVIGLPILMAAAALLMRRFVRRQPTRTVHREPLEIVETLIASGDPQATQDEVEPMRWYLTYACGTVLTVSRESNGWIRIQLLEPFCRLEKQLDGQVSYVVFTVAGKIRYPEDSLKEGYAWRIRAILGKILPLIPNIDL